MHRNVLIIISVLFICLGFGLLAIDRLPFTQFTELTADASGRQFAAAICLKVGMALGAVWLAVPERLDQLKWDQILRRAFILVPLLCIIFMPKLWFPAFKVLLRFWPIALAAGFLMYLVRPRKKKLHSRS